MSDQNLEKEISKTYIQMIRNSEGTKLFNSVFVKDKTTRKVFDVLNDGEFSCAVFVSGILTLLTLMDRPHATVTTVVEKLPENGFEKVEPENLKAGDILQWEEVTFEDGSKNEHIGFYIDEVTAFSTSWTKREVVKHHPTFGEENGEPKRKIVAAFHNNKL